LPHQQFFIFLLILFVSLNIKMLLFQRPLVLPIAQQLPVQLPSISLNTQQHVHQPSLLYHQAVVIGLP